jgi:phage-related protein
VLAGSLSLFAYNPGMDVKPLKWIASSYKDLMALPAEVCSLFDYALSLAQAGKRHVAAKVPILTFVQ